jgi:hypothetical protein
MELFGDGGRVAYIESLENKIGIGNAAFDSSAAIGKNGQEEVFTFVRTANGLGLTLN